MAIVRLTLGYAADADGGGQWNFLGCSFSRPNGEEGSVEFVVIQYFPVRREADCSRSRTRESLGIRASPQSLTTSATRKLGTTVIRH